jgi:Holliday junction resolvase
MPNRNYQRGRRHEYDVKRLLEEAGYVVTRAAGSHSPFDLIASRIACGVVKEVWMLQLKVTQVTHGDQ